MKTLLVLSFAASLLLGLLPAVASAEAGWATDVSSPASARDTVPLKRTAELTEGDRADGVAPSVTPYNRLVSATFDIDLDDREFFGEATLAGPVPAPPNSPTPTVFWVPGTYTGTSCNELDAEDYSDTFSGSYTNEREDLLAGWESADCVAALLYSADGVLVDVLVGPLVDELPSLSIGRPELLGSTKLGLVRGVWTAISVPVANAGPGSTGDDVRVTGAGKGLKVRAGRIGFGIGPGGESSATIQVKLTGSARKARLRLTTSWESVEATRTVSVRRVAPPARPKPGAYRSSDGSVRFSVTAGKPRVSGFTVRTTTDCGTIPTTTTYDFPRTTIPRNGIVDAVQRQDLSTTSLQLRFAGGKVTDGYFSYGGPGGCSANERFEAKVGR